MIMATSLNIVLPEPLKAYVDEQVQFGEYGNPSEYVSDLIRHDQDLKRAALEKGLLKALEGEADAFELTDEEWRAGDIVTTLEKRLKQG
jgi:antitoxin ParD1/3/4